MMRRLIRFYTGCSYSLNSEYDMAWIIVFFFFFFFLILQTKILSSAELNGFDKLYYMELFKSVSESKNFIKLRNCDIQMSDDKLKGRITSV